MGRPGKDGIYSWGEQEEEKGGMKIRLHKGKQQKWSFITDMKVSVDVYVEEEWNEKKQTKSLVTSRALWSKTRSRAEFI